MVTVILETNLKTREIEQFIEICNRDKILPERKVGQLIHDFVFAKGVKHHARRNARAIPLVQKV